MQLEAYGTVRGSVAAARTLWSGIVHRLSSVRPIDGEHVYDREWDLLVVLDACRVDALEAIADEYEFLPDTVPTIVSAAPNSSTWLERNFRPRFREAISETVYVSGNSHTEGFNQGKYELSANAFRRLERVYDYGFDDEIGTVPPSTLTDVAIQSVRNHDPERTIVHYMQPHTPYRSLDTDAIGGVPDKQFRETVWDLIVSGELSRDEAWEAYLDTLRWGLDSVELLLKSVDADRVVITADHGECFGEWGAYGHSGHGTFEALRTVPWIECAACDTSGYEPDPPDDTETVSLEEQLEYLGYR